MCGNDSESVLSVIHRRRSIRSYKPEQLTEHDLAGVLEAAKVAATACGQQLWHFTVVQNKKLLETINAGARALALASKVPALVERASAPGFSAFYQAPSVIIVSVDASAIAPENDATLAIANIMLAAESLDIGTCWIHSIPRLLQSKENTKLVKELKIPVNYVAQTAVAIGYKAAEAPERAARAEGTVTIIR